MKTQTFSLPVSETIGAVTAEYMIPSKTVCVLTLAHGAGAGMDHTFMTTLSAKLAEAGIATLRFNFPFMEKKKKRTDTPATAHATIAAAIEHAAAKFPDIPLYAAGKSFGGRMTSQYLAANPTKNVKGIIFYGFPLHPAGKPGIERAEHLSKVRIPMLFLQGTKDELATKELIEQVCATLKKATLIELEGANHAFKAAKRDVIAELTEATKKWITS